MKKKGIGTLIIVVLATIFFIVLAICKFGGNNTFSMYNIKQGLDLKGGVTITFEAATAKAPPKDQMDSAQSMIQKRLDEKGYTEAEVAPSGNKRLIVDIPGVKNADDAIAMIGQTAKLYFKDAAGTTLLTGDDVATAKQGVQNDPTKGQQYVVELTFNAAGAKKFEAATGANVGKVIQIMLDDTVLSSPVVNAKIIGTSAVIEGSFTQESAKSLAQLISSGSLPFSLNKLSANNVGAKLGQEALSTSLRAGLIGIILVLIFMIVVYKTFGLVADIALILYIGIELFLLILFKVTLTLPGIAGIILSVGMAVDANIIIFERIKEEIKSGKTLRSSAKAGFARAFPAIFDSNITTLIAAIVLFWLGTGTIKGFAQTLAIGIVLSMFTALVVTKSVLNAIINLGVSDKKYYGIKDSVKEVN